MPAKISEPGEPASATGEIPSAERRYPRIELPRGMSVAWYGAGREQVSRVKTLGMGGAFLRGNTLRVGTTLTLVFQVPGGILQAEAVVRNIVLGEGMGVEFIRINPEGRMLLEQLLTRLLR
jgi:PilZ domain